MVTVAIIATLIFHVEFYISGKHWSNIFMELNRDLFWKSFHHDKIMVQYNMK
jgi:hypothetical protein